MQFLISMRDITTAGLKHQLEIRHSSVFFNPNPPEFILKKAEAKINVSGFINRRKTNIFLLRSNKIIIVI